MTTPEREARVSLRERRVQTLLAVRAFEECDTEQLLLGEAERATSTRRALAVTGLSGADASAVSDPRRRVEALTRRARLLFDRLERRIPGLRRMIAVSSVAGLTLPAVVLVATLVGLAGNALGPWRRINLLAFPLFGLWIWNLAVFVSIVARAVARRFRPGLAIRRAHAARVGRALAGTLVRFALRRHLVRSSDDDGAPTEIERIEARAVRRYGALWHRAAGALLARRVSAALHTGSACVVVGLLAGMYLRALAFEYRVGWESTLLDAAAVQALLDVVLGPAASLLGVEVPDVGGLRISADGSGAGGDAAIWIHLFAVTSAWLVILPRIALAIYSGAAAIRLSHRLPVALDDPYYRRAFIAIRGGSRRVSIRPYSYRPKATTMHTLSCLLAEHFGARAMIDGRDPLAYGEPLPPPLATGPDAERDVCRVLLFNVAQTPEQDVHGALLTEARLRAEDDGDELLVGIDLADYAGQPPARREERLRSWSALVEQAGLEPFTVDVGRPVDADALVEIGAAIYRPGASRGGR